MSKRYYVCDIIGDGSEYNSYRPAVADYDVSWSAQIPSSLETGKPLYTNCLVIVGTANHGVLNRDAKIDAMPDFPPIGKLSAMQSQAKSAMEAMLARRGFSTATVQASDGYKDLIQALGKQRNSSFNVDDFDVVE